MCDKMLVLGDIHIGARNSSSIFRELFREYFRDCVFPLVIEKKIKKIIQLGDFFDNRNSVTLHDINYVLTEFIPQLEATGAEMYVLAGNHDVAYKNTNVVNSLTLLNTSKNIHIVENSIQTIETDSKTFVLCPWINDENQIELINELSQYADNNHILCGHFEFANFKMYRTSKLNDSGLDPKQFKKFFKVISGHFHYPSTYGNVSYMGSVFHLNWQDHGDNKYIYIFDTNKDEFEAIENPYSLFTELSYHEDDILNMSDEDLKDFCEGQFVRIIINEEYQRVDLKDIIHKIEKLKPISVDVIDNTILAIDDSDKDENIEVSETKEISDYTEEYVNRYIKDNKESVLKLFEEVYNEAKDKMMEIE